ncbi:MAG: hypothetical protein JSR17_02610 [Proteobacteria bacterium]|nr:hypothetical protein [Pseudomonadota bacterium]
MIDNPHPSFEEHPQKSTKHWWQKLKAILFGQWMMAKEEEFNSIKNSLKLIDYEKDNAKSTFKDWMQAIDVLQPLVQSIRKSIEPKKNDDFDLDMLAANTYLFHIDRLISKIREYLHQYRYRLHQYQENTLYTYKVEINQASLVAEQCYHTILQLTSLLQRLPTNKLYSDELITQIHALELDTTALGSAIRTLNQSAYKAESMVQLAALEQDLLQSLSQAKAPIHPGAGFVDSGSYFNLSHSQGEYLRSKSQLIKDTECNMLINGLIDIHETLKKCYVVARKVYIKEALDLMASNIEALIVIMVNNEIDKNRVFIHFNQIYHSVETIRFNTNRESRCSKNLFEKSKTAMTQLRKVFQKHPLGLEYLKLYSAKRVGLIKSK